MSHVMTNHSFKNNKERLHSIKGFVDDSNALVAKVKTKRIRWLMPTEKKTTCHITNFRKWARLILSRYSTSMLMNLTMCLFFFRKFWMCNVFNNVDGAWPKDKTSSVSGSPYVDELCNSLIIGARTLSINGEAWAVWAKTEVQKSDGWLCDVNCVP